MIISERIFKLMEERGISQIEFSKKTGISQSTISDWKRKKTNPTTDKILVICEALEVSPYVLLQDSMRKQEEIRDYICVGKDTEMYDFLIEIEPLNKDQKQRLMGYLEALKSI